jgi:hypothetical protein
MVFERPVCAEQMQVRVLTCTRRCTVGATYGERGGAVIAGAPHTCPLAGSDQTSHQRFRSTTIRRGAKADDACPDSPRGQHTAGML